MVSSTPMMVMTTSSSIRVNPRLLTSPLPIGDSVQPLARCQGVHVEHVGSGLWIARRALVAAQTPGIGCRHGRVRIKRIARHMPQEIHHRLFLAGRILNAVHQDLQSRWISRLAKLMADAAAVGGKLVGIDCGAQNAQRVMQFVFLGALRGQLHQRHGGARENADDGNRHHQFNQCEAARAHAAQGALMTRLSGCDTAFAKGEFAVPMAETCALMELAARALSALNRSSIKLPSPCTGSSLAAMSNCAPPFFASTFGLPALDGTISPALALMSCRAEGSKRTCPRNLAIGMSVLMRTVTSNS